MSQYQAALVLGMLVAACTPAETDPWAFLDELRGLDEKSDAFNEKIGLLGTVRYGEVVQDFTERRVAAVKFTGRQGDAVRIDVVQGMSSLSFNGFAADGLLVNAKMERIDLLPESTAAAVHSRGGWHLFDGDRLLGRPYVPPYNTPGDVEGALQTTDTVLPSDGDYFVLIQPNRRESEVYPPTIVASVNPWFSAGISGPINALWGNGERWVGVWVDTRIQVAELAKPGWREVTSVSGLAIAERCDLVGIWGSDAAIYAVGSGGCLLRSVDQGETWQRLDSGTTEDLHDVWGLAVPSYLFLAGADGHVLRSTDGGTSWLPFPIASQSCGKVLDLSGTQDHVYAVCESGDIVRSTNRGAEWVTVLHAPGARSLHADGQDVYAVASQALLSSHDAGRSWTTKPTTSQGHRVWGHGSSAYVTTEFGVLQTSDGGQVWSHLLPSFGIPGMTMIGTPNGGPIWGSDGMVVTAGAGATYLTDVP